MTGLGTQLRSVAPLIAILFALSGFNSQAEVEVRGPDQAPVIFGGRDESIPISISNKGTETIEVALRFHLWQLSSSLAMPWGNPEPWRTLTVLGGQTILERWRWKSPDVRAEIVFVVHWIDIKDQLLGQMQVTVVPTNLLQELSSLAKDAGFGLLEPGPQIASALESLKVPFERVPSLETLDHFRGRFAIVNVTRPSIEFRKRLLSVAQGGLGVVVLDSSDKELNHAIIATGRLVMLTEKTDILSDPRAQKRLLVAVRLALNPLGWLGETSPSNGPP